MKLNLKDKKDYERDKRAFTGKIMEHLGAAQ
jgi:hypothetical protein